MDTSIDVELSSFYCCAERHLARLSGVCGLIYPFALRISKKSGKFSCSAASVAEFFGVNLRTAQRGYQQLKKLGFFVLVESGKQSFEPSIYRVLSHTEWAERNPGRCTEKIAYPWTKDGDAMGKALWAASGCQVQFSAFQVNAFRNTGLSESEIVSLFESWYPLHKAEQKGKKWRRSVSFHFLGYLHEKTKGAGTVATEGANRHA